MKRATKPEEREIHLYVVRHQETEGNKKDIIQGHMNTPLTPEGEKAADRVAIFLQQHGPFQALYHSDIGRAVQSTQPILKRNKIPHVHQTAMLRERDYGNLAGKPVRWVTDHEKEPEALDGHRGKFAGSDTERLSQLEQRARGIIDHLYHQPHNKVIIVGHQTMNNYIVNTLLGQPLGKPNHKQGHEEVFKFTLDHLGRVKRWERLKAH